MLFQIKDREDLEKLEGLASLKNQVEEWRLPDKLGEQIFHGNKKIVFEPVTDMKNKTSENLTRALTKSSIKNIQALENINDKLLEIMNDRGKIASYLLSPFSKITNPDKTTQFKLVKDFNSYKVNDLLIHNTTPVTLYDNLLTFRDTGKEFELKADLLKMITNKNCNVEFARLWDKMLLNDFAKKMYFDVKATGSKSTRDRSLMRLLKSPSIMVSASGIWKTIFYHLVLMNYVIEQSYYYKKNRPETIVTKKEISAILDKLIEYKCIYTKQHKQTLINGNLLHTKKKFVK